MHLPAIDELRSARLLLRPVTRADIGDLLEANGDDAVTRFLPYASWTSREDGYAWLARMQALADGGTGQQLVLQRQADGKVVGSLLLFRFEPGSARIEVGYVLGRAHWNQGLMAEALETVCAHLFGVLAIRRIEAEVNSANDASRRLLARLGFTFEGLLRQRWQAKGATYDTCMYSLLALDRKVPAGAA